MAIGLRHPVRVVEVLGEPLAGEDPFRGGAMVGHGKTAKGGQQDIGAGFAAGEHPANHDGAGLLQPCPVRGKGSLSLCETRAMVGEDDLRTQGKHSGCGLTSQARG